MEAWSIGGQLLYCCQTCLPWFIHDYLRDDQHDYLNLAKYIVPSPVEHEKLVDKEPRRNTEQYFWKALKPIIKKQRPKDTTFTPDLVQWLHKEELLRKELEETSGRPAEGPHCWEIPWKCVVIFSQQNKYGRTHYTLVDVCTLEHIDGKEGLTLGWKSHVIEVIKKHRPLRVYVVNSSPFIVSNREYYTIFTISGFVEIYLRPEQVLEDKLLFEVWPRYLMKVMHILKHFSTLEYTSRKSKYVNFNSDLKFKEDKEVVFPKKIKFLENYENKIEERIKKDLKAYKNLILTREHRKAKQESLLIEENINVFDPIPIKAESIRPKSLYSSESINRRTGIEFFPLQRAMRRKYRQEGKRKWQALKTLLRAAKNVDTRPLKTSSDPCEIISDKREYCEYLWRRECYLADEGIGEYFPSSLIYHSLMSNKTHYMINENHNVGLYLGYINDWTQCAPSLIFDNSGKLYKHPAREIIKGRKRRSEFSHELREYQYKKSFPQVERDKSSPPGLIFWRKDVLGLDVDEVTKEYCVTRRRYKTNKGWTDRDWVGREVDRRQYTTGFEWFKDKYPNVYSGAAERWKLKDWMTKKTRFKYDESEESDDPAEQNRELSIIKDAARLTYF